MHMSPLWNYSSLFFVQDLKDMSGKDDNLSQAELAALKKEWLAEMKAQMKVQSVS